MTKRERVINALDCCLKLDEPCAKCSYYHSSGSEMCAYMLKRDALECLKELEQEIEPVKPKLYTPNSKTVWSSWYICGACKHPLESGDKFCRECGRSIKWEELTI